MVPPFLAYYGAMNRNKSAVAESYNQIRLYRNYLRDRSSNNLWRHIVFGDSQDKGHWATGQLWAIQLLVRLIIIRFPGNAWAAAGMLRVLGTIKNSEYAGDFKSERTDLIDWVLEIQDGMYNYLVRSIHPQSRVSSAHPHLTTTPLPPSDQPVVSEITPTTTVHLTMLRLPHFSPPPSTVCPPWLGSTNTST